MNNPMSKYFRNHFRATDAQKATIRLNKSVGKLMRACDRKRVHFKKTFVDVDGAVTFKWAKRSLEWQVVVSKTGFKAFLTHYDKQAHPPHKTVHVVTVDYVKRIDRTTSRLTVSTEPLNEFLKNYFETAFNFAELARMRKKQSYFDRQGKEWHMRPYPLLRITGDTNTAVEEKKADRDAPVLPAVQTPPITEADKAIVERDRQLRRRVDRLGEILKEGEGNKSVWSYEQEHRLENLTRDRESLMAQYRSEQLVDRHGVLPLIEEGLQQLSVKLELMEQAIAERQKQDVERLLLLIKGR